MINHSYTLLSNSRVDNILDDATKRNYGLLPIDDSFIPIILPKNINKLWQALIPSNNLFHKNYIISCYLDILHLLDLHKYTVKFDNRLTYTPGDSAYKTTFDSGVRFNTIIDSTFNYKINKPLDTLGLTNIYNWSIESAYGVEATITGADTIKLRLPVAINKVNIFNDNITLFLPRAVSKFDLQLKVVNPFILRDTEDNIRSIVSQAYTSLSGDIFSDKTDDLKFFKTLWFEHPESVYRLGGLLLALLYKMEELRVS